MLGSYAFSSPVPNSICMLHGLSKLPDAKLVFVGFREAESCESNDKPEVACQGSSALVLTHKVQQKVAEGGNHSR